MGLYNFQKRFVSFIEAGTKRHTIRAARKTTERPGNTVHLYTGLRQKGARLLGRFTCTKVEDIVIRAGRNRCGACGVFHAPGCAPGEIEVLIEGAALDRDEKELLARRDGFSHFAEMMEFWTGRLPFHGQVIHWK